MLSSAIVTESSLQPLWISSAIIHAVGVLVCGGGYVQANCNVSAF